MQALRPEVAVGLRVSSCGVKFERHGLMHVYRSKMRGILNNTSECIIILVHWPKSDSTYYKTNGEFKR